MTEPNFTPAPWSYVKRGHDRYIVDAEGDAICQPFTEAWDDLQEKCKPFPVEANAALLSAAPDLFEALDRLIAVINTNEMAAMIGCEKPAAFANIMDILKVALPALRKARGEQ